MSEMAFWVLVTVCALAMIVFLAFVYWLIMRTSIAAEPDDDEPVAILTGRSELEAELYRSKLDAAGIMAFVRAGGWFAPTMWYRPISGWQVLVRWRDRGAAEECLDVRLATSHDPREASIDADSDVDSSSSD